MLLLLRVGACRLRLYLEACRFLGLRGIGVA
jgi:hypothetical protein